MKKKLLTLALILCASTPAMAETRNLTVLELFTSQGCSSCPPADAFLKELAADKNILPLSFHVSYWDYLGWKDPYSSKDNTQRQYAYANSLNLSSVFTPQLVISGDKSFVGSNESAIRKEIANQSQKTSDIALNISPDAKGNLKLNTNKSLPPVDLWEVHFVTHSSTDVAAGENRGRSLQSVNSVTGISRLTNVTEGSVYDLKPLKDPNEGVAVLAQAPGQGKILGAAVYINK